MSKSLFYRSIILWFLFVPLAIINGTIRNFVYGPYVGELLAHQISTIIMVFLFVLAGYLTYKKITAEYTYKQGFLAGAMLLSITALFEFGFGHYIIGHPWSKLLHDYNLMEGRIWILVLLTVLLTPSGVKYIIRK